MRNFNILLLCAVAQKLWQLYLQIIRQLTQEVYGQNKSGSDVGFYQLVKGFFVGSVLSPDQADCKRAILNGQ